ncbi:MAG: trigger factor family protein, partial [Clostridia bacterium]|nr:trigger factor family protein [Clostridia bacterium]
MLKSANKTETNIYTLEVAVSAEDFKAAVLKAYNKQKNKIQLPGFRKGKAPLAMIEKFYGKEVFYEDAL